MKKSLIILILLLSFWITGCNINVDNANDDIVILYTNDIHTYIDQDIKYSDIAALKASYTNVLLLDAGDHIQGTAYGSMDQGKKIIELMNAAGYDAATFGNHEFDYGMNGCLNAIEWADYPYLSCNFYHQEDGKVKDTVVNPYQIFTFGNVKIAVIGITTPETFTSSTPAYFQDENGNYIYGIGGGEDGSVLYNIVQQTIDLVTNEADYVIALGHLGIDESSSPWRSEDVITNTTGLDAFIDGHSHSTIERKEVLDKQGNTVVLTQTGEYFGKIGKMTISNQEIKTELLTADDLLELNSNQLVEEIENAWISEIDNRLGTVIGNLSITLNNYDEDGNRLVRVQETNAGDFAADALYYLFDNLGLNVDVAIMNGGGIRNQALTGLASYKTCKEIHTFGNVACLQKVTGQQILDALEWGAKDVGITENGGFLQTSGLTYQIDISIPDSTQKDEKGVWIGGPTGKYRVQNVKIYNKETNEWDDLDLNRYYYLAGYNYTLRNLGDGYAMFAGSVNVLDYVMEDYMVLANYITGFEHHIVGSLNSPLILKYLNFILDYSTVDGSGRIKVINASNESKNNN